MNEKDADKLVRKLRKDKEIIKDHPYMIDFVEIVKQQTKYNKAKYRIILVIRPKDHTNYIDMIYTDISRFIKDYTPIVCLVDLYYRNDKFQFEIF